MQMPHLQNQMQPHSNQSPNFMPPRPPPQQIHNQQPHQHNENCRHGHGHQPQQSHSGHNNPNQHQPHQPQQGHQHHAGCSHSHGGQFPQNTGYFGKLRQLCSSNRLFFFTQVISGNCLIQLFNTIHLGFLTSCITTKFLEQILMMFIGFATVECMPLILRPLLSGFLLPYAIFLFMNFKYFSNHLIQTNAQIIIQNEFYVNILYYVYVASLLLILLTSLVGSGSLNTTLIKQKSKKLIKQKLFLNNPRSYCTQCQVVKCFRSQHCPFCRQCVPKFTKHSLFLNQCIGARNQLLYLISVCLICTSAVLTMYFCEFFSQNNNNSIGSIVIFYVANIYVLWLSIYDIITISVYNIIYNCTQFEVKTWMYQPYLVAFMKREFFNPLDLGICNNIKQSIQNIFDCKVQEIQQQKHHIMQKQSTILSSSQQKTQKLKLTTNWNQVIYYNPGQLPNHPHKKQIMQKVLQMESKANQQMKIMQQIRQKVMRQHEGKLSPQQINQMVMMQMQMQMQKQMQRNMMQRQQQMQMMMNKRKQEQMRKNGIVQQIKIQKLAQKTNNKGFNQVNNDSDDEQSKDDDQETLNKKNKKKNKKSYLSIQGEDENI